MFSGKISLKEGTVEALSKAQLVLVSDGFGVERVGQGLIVTLSGMKDLLFQTLPGKIFLSKLVLQPENGALRYSFVYRTSTQGIIHLGTTAACFIMLGKDASMSPSNFWISVVMVNVLVAVFTLGSALHAKSKILKSIRTKI